MNTPVTFELAKLLKEKEFDLSTERFYPKPKCKLFGIDKHSRCYPIVNKTQTYFIGKAAVLKEENFYLAPTIAEVVMWLYEKHGVWIVVDNLIDNKFYFSHRDTKTNNYSSRLGCNDEGYELPTEAYEAAIEYCLTKLI